jgi:hypothetical protein
VIAPTNTSASSTLVLITRLLGTSPLDSCIPSAQRPGGRLSRRSEPGGFAPSGSGYGIDAEEPGEHRLRDTSLSPVGEESLAKGAPALQGAYPRNRRMAGRKRSSGSVWFSSQLVTEQVSAPSRSATWRWSRPRSSRRFRK